MRRQPGPVVDAVEHTRELVLLLLRGATPGAAGLPHQSEDPAPDEQDAHHGHGTRALPEEHHGREAGQQGAARQGLDHREVPRGVALLLGEEVTDVQHGCAQDEHLPQAPMPT